MLQGAVLEDAELQLPKTGTAIEGEHMNSSRIDSLSANPHLQEKPTVLGVLAETQHKPSPQDQPHAPEGSHLEEHCSAEDVKLPGILRMLCILTKFSGSAYRFNDGIICGGKLKKTKF